jgi:FlaG/FlaF family flagellin (archaellin)
MTGNSSPATHANLENSSKNRTPAKLKMQNKIIIGTVLAIATATLLAGCISVNVNKTVPDNSGSGTNTVATPAAK